MLHSYVVKGTQQTLSAIIGCYIELPWLRPLTQSVKMTSFVLLASTIIEEPSQSRIVYSPLPCFPLFLDPASTNVVRIIHDNIMMKCHAYSSMAVFNQLILAPHYLHSGTHVHTVWLLSSETYDDHFKQHFEYILRREKMAQLWFLSMILPNDFDL